MKILVTVKRVVDYEANLEVNENKTFILTDDVNMITNPFDDIAVEAAIKCKESHGGEVIVVSMGTEESVQNIRTALAMGGDRGIFVSCNTKKNFLNTTLYSKILKNIIKKENPDLVIMGKQSIDTDNHQIAEYTSNLLNIGSASQANTIIIKDQTVTVKKEADGGIETVALNFPCLISTDLRLNEPRYASLPGIMKAKKKKIAKFSIDDLNVKEECLTKLVHVDVQPKKLAGIILKTVDELTEKIKSHL